MSHWGVRMGVILSVSHRGDDRERQAGTQHPPCGPVGAGAARVSIPQEKAILEYRNSSIAGVSQSIGRSIAGVSPEYRRSIARYRNFTRHLAGISTEYRKLNPPCKPTYCEPAIPPPPPSAPIKRPTLGFITFIKVGLAQRSRRLPAER